MTVSQNFLECFLFIPLILTKIESKINFVKSNHVLGDGKFQNSESYIYIFFSWGGGITQFQLV